MKTYIQKNELIDIKTLVQLFASQKQLTLGEACDFITSEIIKDISDHKLKVYDITADAMPSELKFNEGADLVNDIYSNHWWHKELKHFNSSTEKIAICKIYALKYCQVTDELISQVEALNKPAHDDFEGRQVSKSISDIVKKSDLINLVTFTKLFALQNKMTDGEACDWITTRLTQDCIDLYSTYSDTLPIK